MIVRAVKKDNWLTTAILSGRFVLGKSQNVETEDLETDSLKGFLDLVASAMSYVLPGLYGPLSGN